jgi:hypothetical protein
MKDTGEDSPRFETWPRTEPFSDREMPSVLREEGMSEARRFEPRLAGNRRSNDPKLSDNRDNMAEMGSGFPIH